MITSASVVSPAIKQGPPQAARPEPTQPPPASPAKDRTQPDDGPVGPTPAFQETFLARVARTALDVRASDTTTTASAPPVDTAPEIPAFAQPGGRPELPDPASDRGRSAVAERGGDLPSAASERAVAVLATAGNGRNVEPIASPRGIGGQASDASRPAANTAPGEPASSTPNDPTGDAAAVNGKRSAVVEQMLRDLNVFAPPPLPLVDLKG